MHGGKPRQSLDISDLDFNLQMYIFSTMWLNHEILLKKLHYYGIRGPALDWFKSYLSGRRQCVTIENSRPSFRPINIRVPQGSILGPILFLLY